MRITLKHLQRMIAIEAHVHYTEPPPPGESGAPVVPFVQVRRRAPVLLSAPHGARTCRNTASHSWHEEDDYTAGMALLLSELCGVSAIATIWRSDHEDPNFHPVEASAYKRALQTTAKETGVRWVIDLHGASDDSMNPEQLVDLGTRRAKGSLPAPQLLQLSNILESTFGAGTVSHNEFAAEKEGRTVTAYSHGVLGLNAVQVEMKGAVRVPSRRIDASAFRRSGPFAADPQAIVGMLQTLADFIASLSE